MGTIIIAIVAVMLVAIFAFQNASPVSISFILWKFEASIAIIIFLCTLVGIIIGITITVLLKFKIRSPSKD
ncbi:MAG: lipopolysaccharide assembly protein LapA domain-containing protein [Thermodesulfovibrionales bacterium]|nr:lipopolysaccharide assembly protein LapA domain-containing protein [Thermodesulfovibrionales bacterium]